MKCKGGKMEFQVNILLIQVKKSAVVYSDQLCLK